MRIRYAVWFIPTKKGMEDFGSQPRELNHHADKDDADMEAYMEGCDDPAPDKLEYGAYHVIKYQDHSSTCTCKGFYIPPGCPLHGRNS